MHVKWERHQISAEGRLTRYQLVALLVDGSLSEGSEKATVLCKLGVIQERFLSIPISKTRAFHQGLFWVKVDRNFEKLGLDKKVCQLLEQQIEEKVPRPADDWALWGVTCIPHIDC